MEVSSLFQAVDGDRSQVPLRRDQKGDGQIPFADFSPYLQRLLDEARRNAAYVDRLVVKASGRVIFMTVRDIDWIEAAGNYVRVHVGNSEHLIRATMSRLEAKLDPKRFLRIHRETIVNIDRVQELHPMFHGSFAVLLKTGVQLTLSRNYRAQVQRQLDIDF
jgi:two-component system LytT family response regulator